MSAPPLPIYLDYHASTPVDPRVADVVLHHMTQEFGNPSSSDHEFGDRAEAAVAKARGQVGALLGCLAQEIVFTSGATESINLALRGLALTARRRGRPPLRIALAPVEHSAVLKTAEALREEGLATTRWLQVDRAARVDLDDIRAAASEGVDVCSVMAANHEVGTLYPLAEVARIVHQQGGLVFCDASQAVGKVDLAFKKIGLDILAFSGHKLYAPKGVGVLAVGAGLKLSPVMTGGEQQDGLRPGTLNVPGIAGLGEACRLRSEEMAEEATHIEQLRDRMQADLASSIAELVVNGDLDNRLPGNLHISIAGLPGRAITARLRGSVAISTGSACRSGLESPSHVLAAMRLPAAVQEGALRIGIGKFTTAEEVDRAAALLAAAADDVKRVVHC